MRGFNDVIGQEHIKEHLQNAISQKKISHAYILTGEAGMGRKSIARAFAMTLLLQRHLRRRCSARRQG